LPKELAGKTAEAFNVTALAFGKDSIKRQRALSAATNACHTDQLVAWERDADITQIVLPGTFDNDIGNGHEYGLSLVLSKNKPALYGGKKILSMGGKD